MVAPFPRPEAAAVCVAGAPLGYADVGAADVVLVHVPAAMALMGAVLIAVGVAALLAASAGVDGHVVRGAAVALCAVDCHYGDGNKCASRCCIARRR